MNGKHFMKGMAAAACALSLAFFGGCSSKKDAAKVVGNPQPNPVDPGKVVNALDSLVNANKGSGKGVVTGYLTGEGKSIADGLLKTAKNAAGERRFLTKSEIPLSGATVLIFNALEPTTFADTTLTTGKDGNYTAVLEEGLYFAFAVYLDLNTFELVTTSIPNMAPKRDQYVKMDTAIAIEDETAPTVMGVYDAASANDDGVFLVGSVPNTNAKINISFSEPMNRESAKGVMLGRVDTASSNTSIVLADTVRGVTLTWSGDSKELTLSAAELVEGAQYAVIIPVSLKDLAKNNLESAYKATFATVKAADIAAVKFGLAATFPIDKESLKPIQNPGVSFNRPVDVFSVAKGASITPAVTGFWEVSGARAMFVHKEPLTVGTTYTVAFSGDVKDLSGQTLGTAASYSFTVKDFEGAAATKTGGERDIALAVETMFDAYLQGDLGRFGANFHANFRLFEGNGAILSKTQFLDMIRKDVGDRSSLNAGFLAPVFDTDSTACGQSKVSRWKVKAEGGTNEDYVWVESFTSMGTTPRVWDKDRKEIDRAKITWDRTGPRFTLDAKKYGFAPDFSRFGGGVNMDMARGDQRFMGDVMAKTSTIVLEPVKMELKESFSVDGGMSLSGDTAKLAVKMAHTEKFSRNNYEPGRSCDINAGQAYERFDILKFLLVRDGTRWMVLSIVSPKEEINKDNFNNAIDVKDFGAPVNIQPIVLLSPVNGRDNAATAEGKVEFKFNGVKNDSVGGYIVGLAEDPMFCGGRPPFGALFFVKASKKDGTAEAFTLNSAGGPESGNATSVLRRAQDLRLPGWERTMYEFVISKMHNPDSGFAGVYQWKVIAVKDSSASQFLASGFNPARFYGESDFGGARGHFAFRTFPAASQFASFENQQFQQPPMMGPNMGPVGFGDMDQDGVPDGMEQKYKTDMRDRNAYPDFRVDTDGDKLADFLEAMLDKDGAKGLVDSAADAAQFKAQIEALVALGIVWQDTDLDGFPDDVEQMAGFDPRNAMSNPGTRPRVTAPIGVFKGYVQMGMNKLSISFKLYTDSTKKLFVAYTAVVGLDTVVDTARAGFAEIMGEVLIAIKLPENGPDAGRALLLRGRYDNMQAMIVGGVEMIPAPANTSDAFGGGPWVGQFAASGRGEDVSRFLPGAGTGPMPGPMTGPMPMPGTGTMPGLMYRLPPAGVNEGAQIVLDGQTAILIDDFGDTLDVFTNVMWRSQPDGSHEFHAMYDVNGANYHEHAEIGGRAKFEGEVWVIDGHYFQAFDSAGIHKGIPGQFCAKASRDAVVPTTGGLIGLKGGLLGWIAQDKFGGGFTGPTNTAPMPCDPSRGPCPDPSTTCQPGMPCSQPTNPYPQPVNNYSRPYMGTAARVADFEQNVIGASEGLVAPVSFNGRIFMIDLDDSTSLSNAKWPLCNHVLAKPALMKLPDTASDAAKQAYAQDSAMLASLPAGHVLVLIEDQYTPGKPALLEKARTSWGEIVEDVYIVEMRPVPPDYGTSANQCGTMSGPNPYPQPQPGNGPNRYVGSLDMVKDALVRSNNMVGAVKDSLGNHDAVQVDPTSLKVDSMTKNVWVYIGSLAKMAIFLAPPENGMLLAVKDGLPLVLDEGKMGGTQPQPNPYPTPTDTTKPNMVFYIGPLENLKGALATWGVQCTIVKDDGSNGGSVGIDANSIKYDTLKHLYVAKELNGTREFTFLGKPTDKYQVESKDGLLAVYALVAPTQHQPGDTTKTPPPLFKGSPETVKQVLLNNGNRLKVHSPEGAPVDALANQASIQGTPDFVAVSTTTGTMCVVFGDPGDPAKPMLTPDGALAVAVKPTTAGP